MQKRSRITRTPDSRVKWQFESRSKAQVMSVWDYDFQSNRPPWEPISGSEINILEAKNRASIEKLQSRLLLLVKKIRDDRSRNILEKASNWAPKNEKDAFGIFLETNRLGEEDLKII
ncbi:MAG TPA: hypothetical protein VJ044_04825, partial [Candidatus Hodarchaeales archaeon]|nr:hypothetical protein [Candidatus Hodarchaeales archaeon]